ncbi:ABC transporter ATP-binding protein [Streptomonospora mangrovi]|uniref:ABC transporter ATP-binding protein n=1 Tax=Streptomonospora mangrovi TaxID=2883123 RepID=UPI0038CDC585
MSGAGAAAGGARVELSGWGWRHTGRASWALRGVDLVVEPGERVLLLGPSGAGKSTLLHAMAGLTGDQGAIGGDEEGRLRVDGRPAAAARGVSALVGQDPESQLVMARAGDDVAFGPENLGLARAEIWARVRATLDAVGFAHGLDRPTAALSGGEKQRLVLAGALAMRPRLLLLDEPTANLDRAGAALVRGVLADLLERTGATMVLVEHRVAEVTGGTAGAADLVDRVVVVEPGGGVVADGSPAAVFARHGRALAERGVWIPGREPRPRLPAAAPGGVLVEAAACTARAPAPLGVLGGRPATVLRDADAVVRSGCATALTGPNGAGKSTLLGLLAGLARPASGTVAPRGRLAEVSARPLARWPARRLARHVGTVFQHAEDQFVTGTVRDELAFGPRRAGLGATETARRVADLLERLRLTGLADAHPFTLSGGEKRRLSVATALSAGPEAAPDVLLLDEPTFGQDTRTWTELVELLADLRAADRAVVMATHDDLLLDRLADTEVVVEGGRTRAARAPGGAAPAAGPAAEATATDSATRTPPAPAGGPAAERPGPQPPAPDAPAPDATASDGLTPDAPAHRAEPTAAAPAPGAGRADRGARRASREEDR